MRHLHCVTAARGMASTGPKRVRNDLFGSRFLAACGCRHAGKKRFRMHIGKAYRKAQTSTSASLAAEGTDNQWKSERASERAKNLPPLSVYKENELAKHLLTKLIVSAGTPAKANYL